ncbi:unnamed protein product, partial [Prorocentrum cordatum]
SALEPRASILDPAGGDGGWRAAGATHGPFAHMGPLEHSLVVAMFCTLSVCLAFAALYGCLNPDACGAERARRVGFEQEAAELRDEIARLSQ